MAYTECSWIGDGPGAINPLDAANAAKVRVETGITTLDQESIAHDGIPWEVKHKQRAKEQAARLADNLIVDPNAPVTTAR
jgi:capsid protein